MDIIKYEKLIKVRWGGHFYESDKGWSTAYNPENGAEREDETQRGMPNGVRSDEHLEWGSEELLRHVGTVREGYWHLWRTQSFWKRSKLGNEFASYECFG